MQVISLNLIVLYNNHSSTELLSANSQSLIHYSM